MTGYQKAETESLKIIDELLRLKYSVGLIGNTIFFWFINCLGGRPGQAYYILGEVKSEYIYLDPHFAQVCFL